MTFTDVFDDDWTVPVGDAKVRLDRVFPGLWTWAVTVYTPTGDEISYDRGLSLGEHRALRTARQVAYEALLDMTTWPLEVPDEFA